MKLLDSLETIKEKKALFFLFLFVAALLFRLPTLFNDFYDVDELAAIVQTHEYMAGARSGIDFTESKHPLYHLIFKTAYAIWPESGWVLVHAAVILIVFGTALFIYLIGSRIRGFTAGAISALLYAVLISSFNRHFMATNAEIVYNLPLAGGLYFLIRFLEDTKRTRWIFILLSIFIGSSAIMIKFHGIIFLIFITFFEIIYYPYYTNRFNRQYVYLLAIAFLVILGAFIIDYNATGIFATKILEDVYGKIFYASTTQHNVFDFIVRFLHRQGMLTLWHFVLWIPAIAFIIKFAKRRFKSEILSESALAVFLIITYLLVFAGGARFYFHYFMTCYPFLCIAAGVAIESGISKRALYIQKRLTIFLLIPSVFFLIWNTKDVLIKHFWQAGFYNEGKALNWTRAVLVGSFNDYLLPETSYKDVCDYIKKITRPGERIYVWGDGPYLYYFSGRRPGVKHMWPKTGITHIWSLYKKGDIQSVYDAEMSEEGMIKEITQKKSVVFIDTSQNGLSTFTFPPTPLVEKYISKNFRLIAEINKMKIWARNGWKPVKE